MTRVALVAIFLLFDAQLAHVYANGYGEDSSWQFQSSADKANLAGVQAVIQSHNNHGYGPSGYYNNSTTTNNIAHQMNCNQLATTYGNYGVSSTTASSPITSGAAPSSVGNTAATSNSLTGPGTVTPTSSTGQTNSGAVSTSLNGATNVSAGGTAYQALNSTQSNGGSQGTNITGSSACSAGAGGVLN